MLPGDLEVQKDELIVVEDEVHRVGVIMNSATIRLID